ncbi:hypothetical protein [Enhygromyxa salina]|nr:hypothetical protein [Enhygromyxa salina]
MGVAGAVVLSLGGSACVEEPHEPNWLFQGKWIDIDGRDRSADETCGGTFAYVDAYAGALAVEFGVTGHLGPYRWYSPEQYAAELPCDDAVACYSPSAQCIHSRQLPDIHEVVHMAAFAAVRCPDVLGEGLAEFYDSGAGLDAQTRNLDLLAALLDAPSFPRGSDEYGIVGRFAAYLVEHFGVEAVLDVCRITDRFPDGPALAAAFKSVLGMTTKELLADFELELGPSCNRFRNYQSRVFACGAAQAAPDLGLVSVDGEHAIEETFTLDCANDIMIGPLDDKMWLTRRFDIDADEIYVLGMWGEDGAEIPGVELTLVKCEPCAKVLSGPGPFIGPMDLDAGRYALELHAPADFRGRVTVVVKH